MGWEGLGGGGRGVGGGGGWWREGVAPTILLYVNRFYFKSN